MGDGIAPGGRLSGRHPADVRRALQDQKLWRFLVPSADTPTISTFPHFAAVMQLCSAASLRLGIDVGVNMLGLLPVLLGGSSALRSEAARRMKAGAYCSLLL